MAQPYLGEQALKPRLNVILTIPIGPVVCKSVPDFLVDSDKTGSNVVLTISIGPVVCKSMPDFLVDRDKTGSNVKLPFP